MSTPDHRPTRRDAVRRLVVARADAAVPRRRFPIVAGLLGFVVAGALSGAAVAAVAGQDDPSGLSRGVRAAGLATVTPPGTQVVGATVAYTGTGMAVLELPERPPGADAPASWIRCDDALTWEERVDGTEVGSGRCPSGGRSGGVLGSGSSSPERYELRTEGGEYAVVVGWIDLPEPVKPSAAQKEALDDGVVTRPEYVAAFNRYLGCMNASGHGLGNVDQEAEVFEYLIVEDAVIDGTNDRCYAAEFAEVDVEWQVSVAEPNG